MRLIAAGVTLSSCPAAVKLPVRAAASNALTPLRNGSFRMITLKKAEPQFQLSLLVTRRQTLHKPSRSPRKEESMTGPTGNSGVIAPPPLLYLGTLIVAFVLHWLWPAPILGHATWEVWCGVVLGALGLGLGLWGRSKMISAGTNINPLKPTTSIVTSGPFRFTRNPLYVGMTLLYLGL